MRKILFTLILCTSIVSTTKSQILRQSTGVNYTSLQTAIDALPDTLTQNEILQFQGTNTYIGPIYIEDIVTGQHKLIITSKNGLRPKIDAENGTLALIIDNTNNVTIDGIEFLNASKTDLSSTLFRVTNNSNNIQLKNCYIHDARTGIRITVNSSNVTIYNCQFSGIGFGAIRIDDFNNVMVKNCAFDMTASVAGGMGLRVVNGDGFEFIENTIFGTLDKELLSIIKVNDIDIERNILNNSGGAGIFIAPITGSSLSNDSIKIFDNLFYNNSEPSIFMECVKDVEIYNNTFDSKNQHSVIFAWKENENISLFNNIFYVENIGTPILDLRSDIINASSSEFNLDYNLYKPNPNRDLLRLEFNGVSTSYTDLSDVKSGITTYAQHSLSGLIDFNKISNPNEPYYLLKATSLGINAGHWDESRATDIRLLYKTNNQTDIGAYHRDASGVSLEETDLNFIKVYPNPFKDYVIINTNDFKGNTYTVKLINHLGQEVHSSSSTAIEESDTIYLSDLKNGFYYIEVRSNSKTYRAKLLKASN